MKWLLSPVWRGSLVFWSQGVESYYLGEQKLRRREQSRLPPPPVSFYPFLHPPPSSLLPPSAHQHKRLPSDTPLRSSFLELSSKTHSTQTHRHTHTHTHTHTHKHCRVGFCEEELLCSQSKADKQAKWHGVKQKGRTDRRTDRQTPFPRRVNQAYMHIKKEKRSRRTVRDFLSVDHGVL